MDRFLYDIGLRHERVKCSENQTIKVKYYIEHFSLTKNWQWPNMHNYINKAIYRKIHLWYGTTQDITDMQNS